MCKWGGGTLRNTQGPTHPICILAPDASSTLYPPPDACRRGVLTEAALALEAAVTANPGDAEAWRLLGTVHAENDDDQQVRKRG